MEISVIICSHNPRADYIQCVLDALNEQDLLKDKWELLLIDNASEQALSDKWDLSWHPNSRHIFEGKLGLTSARLRGIQESKGAIIVFVDDDNILDKTYLTATFKIAEEFPFLGVWGANISGEFEKPVEDWMRPHLWMLGIQHVNKRTWICNEDPSIMPIGAGLCIRRIVAEAYVEHCATHFNMLHLDRRGKNLSSAGDNDICLTACELDMGIGVFPELNVTHLIPAGRLELRYFSSLCESMQASWVLLRTMRGLPVRTPTLKLRILTFLKALTLSPQSRCIYFAGARGHRNAFFKLAAQSSH